MLAAAPAISFASLVPELVLVAVGCAVLLVAQAGRESVRRAVPWVTLVGIAAAILILRGLQHWGTPPADDVITGGLAFDNLAGFVRIGALIFGVLVVLACWAQPPDAERGEFFSMMLFSLAGLMLVGPSVDLVVLFLALELVSIPTYIMVALGRRGPLGLEAATKYFYLGALAAAITAFGFSYLYGVMGTAVLDADAVFRIKLALQDPGSPEHTLATIGVLVSIVGLLFKIAAVPLHFYIADVYQGAASPVAGMLGFVPKLAGLVALFKIIALTGWQTTSGPLFWVLWIVAVLSMTIGNVLALRQNNIKRMLAYSGVAHSGYMLVGILAGPFGDSMMGDGTAAVLYYVMIYGIANLGAFALLGLLWVRGRPCETLRDVAGLLRHYPSIALLMALAMFTLMGLPPTPGFWGKLSLFGSALAAAESAPAALHDWIIALVIIAVLNSALAAAYYLRVIAAVLLFESDEPAEPAPREAPMIGALLCGFLLLVFAFYPRPLMRLGRMATDRLLMPPAAVQTEAETPSLAGVAPFGEPSAQ
ncbi:MAG: NADH-quinone oxidoreductase subunit N [Planctomycetes bacterium]|nr:NADH-quinone oxidoreductase subunit N [Planctomycetota bacterium]